MNSKTTSQPSSHAEINEIWELEILTQSRVGTPSSGVIKFRSEEEDKLERPVIEVPLSLVRFRVENCRIIEFVGHRESTDDHINSNTEEDQKWIQDAIWNQDEKKNTDLLRNMKANKQEDEAVITADGYVVDGNRRLCVLKKLSETDTSLGYMKCVLLPGNPHIMKKAIEKNPDAEKLRIDNGKPTIDQIESSENQYQNIANTKLDYEGFATAFSYYKRLKKGIKLEAQLREHADKRELTDKEMKTEIGKVEKKLIKPLELVYEYLNHIGRPGALQLALGKGPGFNAFVEHYARNISKIKDEAACARNKFDENQRSEFKEVCWAFMRTCAPFKKGQKMDTAVRQFFTLWQNKDSRQSILKQFKKVKEPVPESLDPFEHEDNWKALNQNYLKTAFNHGSNFVGQDELKSEPMDRILAAYSKLSGEKMDISNIAPSMREDAIRKCNEIQTITKELINDLMNQKKGPSDLKKKYDK